MRKSIRQFTIGLFIVALGGATIVWGADLGAPTEAPRGVADGLAAYERAVAAVNNDSATESEKQAAIDAFVATQPRLGDVVIVEGDIRLPVRSVRAYLARRRADAETYENGELMLATDPQGNPSYLIDAASRHLTFRLDAASFPSAALAATARKRFLAAVGDWIGVCKECGLSFAEAAANASPDFFIRYTDQYPLDQFGNKIPVLASAFFPHDLAALTPPEVLMFPIYFTEKDYDPVGMLRHEIGHILGYRHEHYNFPGCFPPGVAGEDPNLIRLVAVADSLSVMAYPCMTSGAPADVRDLKKKFEISPTDSRCHRLLYTAGVAAAKGCDRASAAP
ncbi:MAG: hypothetical protein AB7P23_13125 [Amphiplicatus sp.]